MHMMRPQDGVSSKRTSRLAIGMRIIGGVCSLVLSMLGGGIFLWGSPLLHPNLQGLLLCIGPIISFPAFLTLCFFRKFHKFNRILMWLVAVISGAGALAATLTATKSDHPLSGADIVDAFHSLLLPTVLLSFAIAVLVEFSYWAQSSADSQLSS